MMVEITASQYAKTSHYLFKKKNIFINVKKFKNVNVYILVEPKS